MISPEAIRLLKRYSSDLSEERLPQALQQGHVLYHGMHDFKLRRDWFDRHEELATIGPDTWHEKTSFLVKMRLLQDTGTEFVVKDQEALDRLLEQLYLDPIKQYLEEKRPLPAEGSKGDPNTRTEVIGVKLGNLLDGILKQEDESWTATLIDSATLDKAKERIRKKVPEDPRTRVYQFLTLGELKELFRKRKVWAALSDKFVNSPGSDPDPSRFQTEELFFGCLELVIAYRNPPSHGVNMRPDRTNMAMIDATLSKLERILNSQ